MFVNEKIKVSILSYGIFSYLILKKYSYDQKKEGSIFMLFFKDIFQIENSFFKCM